MINDSRTHFSYDPETHTTYCEREGKHTKFYGSARCHPNDWEFESKLVGEHYAYTRSMIEELVANRNELRAELKVLRHLYNILEQNPRVHYDSIECFTIRKQIKNIERDLADVRDLIRTTKSEMRDMMEAKDEFYKKLRKVREENVGKETEDSVHS